MPHTLRSSTGSRKPSPSYIPTIPEDSLSYSSLMEPKALFQERERAHHALLGRRAERAKTFVDPMGNWFVRKRLLMESTFALSMLEPWEKLLVVCLCLFLLFFILLGVFRYLPFHLEFLNRRARFYILGDEAAPLREVMVLVGAKWAGGV